MLPCKFFSMKIILNFVLMSVAVLLKSSDAIKTEEREPQTSTFDSTQITKIKLSETSEHFYKLFLNNLTHQHLEEIVLNEGESRIYQFSLEGISLENSTPPSLIFLLEKKYHDNLVHFTTDPRIINVTAGMEEGSLEVVNGTLQGYINVTGQFVGFASLEFEIRDDMDDVIGTSSDVMVKVMRIKSIWELLFVVSIIILITVAYINMGCAIDLEVVKNTLRRPVAPAIGLVSQYIFMPLCSFGLGYALFQDDPAMWLGIFLTGCSPGGGGSNVWVYVLQGSLDLSVTMTFVSTLTSYVAFPLWVFLLGRYIPLYSDKVKMPYMKITQLIVALIVPIGIGLLIKRFLPRVAVFMKKMLKPLALFFIVFVVLSGVIVYRYIFNFLTWQVLVSSICLPWLGFLFGLGLSLLSKRNIEDAVAICIETGVQNTGLTIGVLQLAFQDEAPLGDIGILVPIMVATMTPLPLFVVYVVKLFRRPRRKEISITEDAPSE